MSGLILKLGPNERVLINGAVIQNGLKRASISIKTQNASILRLKDAIHPDSATTPVGRLCYLAQLVLTGDVQERDAQSSLLEGIEGLVSIFFECDTRNTLEQAREAVVERNFYLALKKFRLLLPDEARLLADLT